MRKPTGSHIVTLSIIIIHQFFSNISNNREFGIDGMKYYFSWERIKEQRGVCLCVHDQTVYINIYYVDMNMMYVNCQVGNNKK